MCEIVANEIVANAQNEMGANEMGANEICEIGEIDTTSWAIFHQYVTVMNDYLTHFMATEKFKKRDCDSNFLLMNGFTTLTHVFKITLNHINVEKAIEQTDHSIYYYTQFIEQMEENIMYDLNVSSNAASLFVYKKTIQHLLTKSDTKNEVQKNEVQKNEVLKNEVLKNVDYVLLLYRTILDMLLPCYMLLPCHTHTLLPLHLLAIAFELCQNNTTEATFKQELLNVLLFINHFPAYTSTEQANRYDYIHLYVKKYKHRELTLAELCQKKAHPSYADKLKNETPNNYIKWLFL